MEKLKQVLHISTPITWRGGEQQLYYLLEKSRKYKHTVVCPENSVLAERLKNIPYVDVLHYDNASFFTRWLSIQKAIKLPQFSFDIMHTHDAKAHSLALYALMALGRKIPLFVHRRVDFAIRKNAIKSYKYTHHLVYKVISVSNAIDALVAEKLPAEKRCVVYSGVDLSAFEVKTKNIKDIVPFSESAFVFCNVAALAPHKDQITLIKAFAELKRLQPKADIKLVIAGEGKSRAAIEDAIKTFGVENDVVLLGYRNDVKQWLSSADAFVITSETEGLGTSIIDAMAAKLPIAATKAGGIAELIEHEKTGLLCPVRDFEAMALNMQRLYLDKELCNNLQVKAYNRAQDFSHITMVEGIEALYEEALSSSSSTSKSKA